MEFGSVTNNRLKILERINSVDDEYSYAPPLLMLDDFRMYIRPFEAFSYSAEKSKAIDALHNVLKETPRILKKHKIAITTETDVSKEVRWVLDLYFDTRATNSRFIKKHQNYKPDTLIPLLGVAIEFKLVREKAKVAIYLDQLIVDATNYTDDPHYTNFIAVLCLQDSTITEKSVLEAWKEKKFPNNWKLIIVYI